MVPDPLPHPKADVIDAWWARRFGCLLEDIQSPGIHVTCRDDVDPAQMAVLELKHATLIRAASEHQASLAEWAKSQPPDAPCTADDVSRAIPNQAWKVSPSEKVLYLNPKEFRPFNRQEVRELSQSDSHDLTVMHRGGSLEEQKAGEVNIDHRAIFGAYVKGQLVAAASFIDQGEGIADVGVLVHRDFRGQGFGRAVVSALCQWGLDHDRIVQYWRFCGNIGSARIADSLGFTEYGRYQVLHLGIAPFSG
jgi:RimJ/RimL family protein N-acetyltransferase